MRELLDVIVRPFRALPGWIAARAVLQRVPRSDPLPGTMDDIATYHRERRNVDVVLSDRTWAAFQAEHAEQLRVETLVGRHDDLSDGKSYFYAEAERVKEMLDIAAGGQRCLFIIDELYRRDEYERTRRSRLRSAELFGLARTSMSGRDP